MSCKDKRKFTLEEIKEVVDRLAKIGRKRRNNLCKLCNYYHIER